MDNVLRYKIADYINITPDQASESYKLMGVGFNSVNEDPKPTTDSKTYVNQRNSTTAITGYEPEFAYDMDLIADEDAVMFLWNIGRDRKTGKDAETDYIRVDLFSPVDGSANNYKARKMRVTVEAGSTEGDGGKQSTSSGTLHQVGDHTDGTFNTTTNKFTASGE